MAVDVCDKIGFASNVFSFFSAIQFLFGYMVATCREPTQYIETGVEWYPEYVRN